VIEKWLDGLTELTDVGWRRAWGLFDAEQLVGHLYLEGGALRSELHRVDGHSIDDIRMTLNVATEERLV
jgi:hypothetical protein